MHFFNVSPSCWRLGYILTLSSGVPYCNSHHQEETANEKKTINFLKLSAPWEVLVYHAEEMCIRAPLQVRFGKGYGKNHRI